MLKIWIWCLIKATFKNRSVPLKIGKGETIVKIKRGEFIFGRHKAEEELFIDGSTIYKIMQKLQQLDMISIKSSNQYSIITVCNYGTYQSADNYEVTSKEQPSNNQVTSKEQPSNTNKNVKKVKKVNNVKKEIYIPPYPEFLEYCLTKKSDVNQEALKLKYESWKENNWKDGYNKKIVNWKSKILNTIPYLKEKINNQKVKTHLQHDTDF